MIKKQNSKKADLVKELVETSLSDDKALDIVTIDLTGKSDIADYMVIASGTSARHVGSLADKLVEKLKQVGVKSDGSEGQPQNEWVLVDNPYVIVHIFKPETRGYYNLEKMWQANLKTLEAAF